MGHSTRSLDELRAVLDSAEVRTLIDVRSAPGSRRHPQFSREALAEGLGEGGIEYRHEPALGGFRRPRADSPNTGWRHEAFRGYADHMASEEFRGGLDTIQTLAREHPACLMCAEAQWWRCHRRLIADALLIRGWTVLHLGLQQRPVPHELTPFAVPTAGYGLTYPPEHQQLAM